MSKIRHVLGISGGKDSAALAIYLANNYPELDIEYYFADTGKELAETYDFIDNLEIYLGKKVARLKAVKNVTTEPFDYFLTMYGGYLPSSRSRWCTRKLKLEPFEEFVGNTLVISYVAIRGDEDREGYISQKTNIQSIFPFRKNIWSEDVIRKVLSNDNIPLISELYNKFSNKKQIDILNTIVMQPLSPKFTQKQKLNSLLNLGITAFNKVVFTFLKKTDYPLSKVDDFRLLDNEDILVRDDVFRLLVDSGIGKPKYYNEIEFEIDGKKGYYFRSRSGCFFCFFQQTIEWVWLYEQHPDLFQKAMEYEKVGFTWRENESLEELIKPERIREIKEKYLKKVNQDTNTKPKYLLDIILDENEGKGCIVCFI